MHIETHRDRMTTDMHFTLHLLDRFPYFRLTGDLSHYLVGREFAWPVEGGASHPDAPHPGQLLGAPRDARRAVSKSRSRSTSRSIRTGWGLFMAWWEFRIVNSWRRRAPPDATLTFLCELGASRPTRSPARMVTNSQTVGSRR